MIICTTPFKPSRMIKAFKKAYNDQKASYYKKNFNRDQHVIDPPGSLEKAQMAVKAAGVAVVIELGMLTHCI